MATDKEEHSKTDISRVDTSGARLIVGNEERWKRVGRELIIDNKWRVDGLK